MIAQTTALVTFAAMSRTLGCFDAVHPAQLAIESLVSLGVLTTVPSWLIAPLMSDVGDTEAGCLAFRTVSQGLHIGDSLSILHDFASERPMW